MTLQLERLESRCVPAATAVLSHGVLTVQGTEAAEAFTLKLSSGTLRLSLGSKSWSFAANSVTRVEADLAGGNDNWNGLATGYKGAHVVRGSKGDDAITTGEGDDTIYGDDGNDSIVAWAGRDVVFGGAGNDWIPLNSGDGSPFGYPADVAYGGAGADEILAGSNDSAFGEDGNDKLTASAIGAVGGAYLDGGNGDDVFYAREGQYRAYDTIVGGPGFDRLATSDSRGPGDVYEYLPRDHGIEQIG